MCGIFGIFDRSGVAIDRSMIERMGNLIRHRGPDDQGTHLEAGIALGNQRLSVIDLAGGHQPMTSDDGNIVVVQNGEIFNFVELRDELRKAGSVFRTSSDTEVILRLYESLGIHAFERLNGMFAIAILDKRTGELHVVRDRIGIKPLYVADDGTRFVFASEIKSILAAGVPREPDLAALHDYLTFNYCVPPATAFKHVRHVPPGHYLTVRRDAPTKSTMWWDLSRFTEETSAEDSWSSEILTTLRDAVRIRLRSDVPFGAFLSGGIDSSTIVGLMAEHLPQPVKTFSIGFDDPRFDESLYASEAAIRFKTDHYSRKVQADIFREWPLAIYHCDQPHGDASFIPTYLVSRLAREHVTVVLTGDGGDELFAGYDKYRRFFSDFPQWARSIKTLEDETRFREEYYDQSHVFTDALKASIYAPEMSRAVSGLRSFDSWVPLWNKARHFDPVNQVLFLDMMLLLSGNNLVKPDRMGMAVSLEARTPFLDYRMMELAFRIPGNLKLRDGETKYILKKTVSNLIGQSLAYRSKQMFTVPIGEWFKDRLQAPVRRFLLSAKALDRGLFERSAIERLLDQHISGSRNFTRELRALVALEIWHRIFIDRTDLSQPHAEEVFGTDVISGSVSRAHDC